MILINWWKYTVQLSGKKGPGSLKSLLRLIKSLNLCRFSQGPALFAWANNLEKNKNRIGRPWRNGVDKYYFPRRSWTNLSAQRLVYQYTHPPIKRSCQKRLHITWPFNNVPQHRYWIKVNDQKNNITLEMFSWVLIESF